MFRSAIRYVGNSGNVTRIGTTARMNVGMGRLSPTIASGASDGFIAMIPTGQPYRMPSPNAAQNHRELLPFRIGYWSEFVVVRNATIGQPHQAIPRSR